MEKFDLAPAEWNIMECLWERAPQTGRELTEQLEASMGWSRSTTLTLLRRMVGKGVVTCDTEVRSARCRMFENQFTTAAENGQSA